MADIHPYVLSLIRTLTDTPLEVLAEMAIARIREDEVGRTLTDPETTGSVAERGFRHLNIAHAVIVDSLKLELALMDRLSELAPRLRLKEINVLPDAQPEVLETATGIDRLLSSERKKALQKFLDRWLAAEGQLRPRLESDIGR